MHESDEHQLKDEIDAIAKQVDAIMDKINNIYPMADDTSEEPETKQA